MTVARKVPFRDGDSIKLLHPALSLVSASIWPSLTLELIKLLSEGPDWLVAIFDPALSRKKKFLFPISPQVLSSVCLPRRDQ